MINFITERIVEYLFSPYIFIFIKYITIKTQPNYPLTILELKQINSYNPYYLNLKNAELETTEISKGMFNEYLEILYLPKNINQIAKELEISICELSYKLTIMEMEGFIKCLPGKFFIRCF